MFTAEGSARNLDEEDAANQRGRTVANGATTRREERGAATDDVAEKHDEIVALETCRGKRSVQCNHCRRSAWYSHGIEGDSDSISRTAQGEGSLAVLRKG